MSKTFSKAEKLKSRKLIEQLFDEGKRLNSFPLQIVYLPIEHPAESTYQAGFSVSKRRFKLAVDRNRIKRIMRETYRLNKNLIEEKYTKKYIFMFVYTTNQLLTHKEINVSMTEILNRLLQKL